MSDLDSILQTLVLEPKKGDVLVLQIDKNFPMERLWDRLEDFRKRSGLEILTVTDDIVIYPINENGNYALIHEHPLPEEHKERIVADWKERFPNSKLALVQGGPQDLREEGDYPTDVTPRPVDDTDIL